MRSLSALDLRLDPWEADYGAELLAGGATDKTLEEVDASVECAPADWRPIRPAADTPLPPSLLFVDGVRRVEARVVAEQQGRLVHGAFGSFGVGVVRCNPGAATIEDLVVERVLALDSGESLSEPVAIAPGLTYRIASAAPSDPNAPLARLQEEMRLCEERLARERALADEALVVSDGPLTFAERARGAAVGFVKRLHELYVDAKGVDVLARIPMGTRSPILSLSGTGRFERFSWFVRLSDPGPADAALAGLARLEVASGVGLQAAKKLADATALTLPRFVPSRGRDPRAPQNLLPIGALEAHLRRRLGDARILRRKITEHLAREPAHA